MITFNLLESHQIMLNYTKHKRKRIIERKVLEQFTNCQNSNGKLNIAFRYKNIFKSHTFMNCYNNDNLQ